MAGRPRRRAVIEELTRLAMQEIEEGEQPDILAFVVSWVESGKTMNQLAKEIRKTTKDEVPTRWITDHLTRNYPDAKQRMADARAVGAHALVESTVDIIDDLGGEPSKEEVAAAKLKIDTKQWIAERYNRAELGAAPKVAVQLNVNSMHLDAMRTRVIGRPEATDALPLPAHARLISDGTDTLAEDAIDSAIVVSESES